MALTIPNLDDRTFDQLTAEAQGLIAKNFPAWTDHNLSDPGITLLELFAFLIEIAIYQINRVPERSLEHFAELVGVKREPLESIDHTLRRALEALQLKYRAVTEAEFETLVTDAFEQLVARARVVVEVVDTPNVFPDEQFIKVIIVPNDPNAREPEPTNELRQKIFEFLRERCLITTRVQVVKPKYDGISIRTTILRNLTSNLDKDIVQRSVEQAIRNFLSPLTGGVSGTGWEFGRSVFRSELYQLIEGLPGVDHVRQLLLEGRDEAIGEVRLTSPASLVKLDGLDMTMLDT